MDEVKCPKCGADMILRKAKRGQNAGNSFYGCSNYFVTKCNGTIAIESSKSKITEKDNTELGYYIPTQIIAKPYYPGFEVSFYQSMAIPYKVLNMVNNDEIGSKELKRYSQYRVDYCLSNKAQINNGIRDIFNLIKKILTRGTITILSENMEIELEKLYKVKEYNDFRIDCLIVHNKLNTTRRINFDNSKYEEKFYYEDLPFLLGDYYQYYTMPQVSLESLIDSDNITEVIEQRRVDFVITTNKANYVIELDGNEHNDHKDRDAERDALLEKSGYKVIRISNRDNFLNAIGEIGIEEKGHIRYVKRLLNNSERVISTIKISHQIMIALLDALLHQYDYKSNNKVYINFSSDSIEKSKIEKVCLLIEKEFNDLLSNTANLFNQDFEIPSFSIRQFEKEADGLIISFNEKYIDSPNNMVINDIYINKVIANLSNSTSLRYYEKPEEENLEYFLNYIFRKEKFREGQYETISRGLQGKDTLVLLPTGAGKSIAFQLTSMLLNGVTLVVDPIIALINDQIENLNRIGIDRISGITSLVTDFKTREKIMKAFSMGDYLITFIAPERLQSKEFRLAINGLTTITPIPLVAIDEAHCVSEWGHDFRTSYLNIGRITREFCGFGIDKPCLIGLTGTASNTVLRDVQRELDIKEFDAIITPKTFDRKELSYGIFKSASNEKDFILRNLLNRYFPEQFMTSNISFYSQNGKSTKCGLIFCPHVNGDFGVKKVADSINNNLGLQAKIYSGEQPKNLYCTNWNNEKSKVAKDYKNNKFNLMITTKAFGMGIDKPNINYTVHYGLPSSIESFYQEAGRAGRNGDFSKCILLISNDNPSRTEKLLDPQSTINQLKLIMDNVSFENADDITRALFFHLNSFKGIEAEVESIKLVIQEIGDLGTSRKIIIKANASLNRTVIEKALYRLIVLGAVTDYTIDYSSDEFIIEYQVIDRYEVIDRYALYVSGYNKTRVNKETEKLQEKYDLLYGDFLIESSKILINFIYDTIEKGRRRGIAEVLLLAEAALKAEDADEIIRKRILRYLETTYSEEIEKILNVDELKLDLIRDLIDGYETADGNIIGGLRSPKDAEEIRGQVSRYLESTPDHPGLLMVRALSELFCSDYNKITALSAFEAAVKYANDQIGYSIYATEFYKLIAWSVLKIGEKDLETYIDLIKELLDRFDNIEFAKDILSLSNNVNFMLVPSNYIISKNCIKINEIIRRKNNA